MFPECCPKQMWERACSRKRWISQHCCRLTLRFREQARSHRGYCVRLDYRVIGPEYPCAVSPDPAFSSWPSRRAV
ncbi:hypothetical protein C0J26_00310 [Pseudomonas baetica]|nr:hypothetical protein C0J26_00310 [Pseudomonas baetica]